MHILRLSPDARYAVAGMRRLAGAWGGGRFLMVGDLAEAEKLPANFLSKIFQKLARRGLLASRRGPGGGYALAKPPADIFLADILLAIQGDAPLARQCLLSGVACAVVEPCVLHEKVARAQDALVQALGSVALADLLPGDKP